mmetsp:Transcript_72077/g.136086  ORF Transcript_72077/g.136086 Transcript_72077/m.136086 type:complete len:169 (+) Transcript_72077:121-627(+)
MSNTKWGFEKEYGHKVLPTHWHRSSGFTHYDADPLRKKNFHEQDLPIYREDFISHKTSYDERPQDSKNHMSAYGCHRDMPWTNSLRSPRNPFPGLNNREQKYTQEPSPSLRWRKSEALALTARSIATLEQEPAIEHRERLKGWLQEWNRTATRCRKEHARMQASSFDE